jgi:photosystem II stability/assembly factor-like uncharacterized protein
MVGPNLAFAGFQRRDGSRLLTELHRSTDGGRTWRPASLALPGTVAAPSMALSFADERHGWLVFTSRDQTDLFRTADGGLTWQLLGSHPIIPSVMAYAGDMTVMAYAKDMAATGLSFADERRGAALAATGTAILLTDDGGQTWRHQPLPVNGRFVTFTPAGDIWLVSGENVLHSADGGLTWQSHQVMRLDHGGGITSPAGWRRFNHQPLRFLTLSRGWTALSDGTLVVTDDGGHTWRQVWPVLPYLVPAP